MNKGEKLIKNTIILFFGKICTQFVSFLLLPFYTSYLTTSSYGIFDLLQNYVIVLVPIINLEIELGLFKFIIDNRSNAKMQNDIIFNCFFNSFLLYLIFCFILLILFHISKNINFIYISIMLFISIITNLCLQLTRGRGNNLNYAKSCILSALCNLLFCILFLKILNLGLQGAIFSSIISSAICSIYLVIKENIFESIKTGRYNIELFKSILKYSIPLIPGSIAWWIINVSDRIIISIFIGSNANGIYALSNKFPSIISALYNIFIMSWTEIVFLYVNDDEDHFICETFNSIIKIISSACILLNSLMFILFPIFVNDKFQDAYNYIPILMFSAIFSNIVATFSPIYLAKNKTKEIAKTSFFSGILNIFLNVFLIKYIGIWAAVISTLISFVIVTIYRYIDAKEFVYFKLDYKYCFIFIIMSISNIILYYMNNFYGNFLNFILMTIFFIVVNRKYIILMISKIGGKLKNE